LKFGMICALLCVILCEGPRNYRSIRRMSIERPPRVAGRGFGRDPSGKAAKFCPAQNPVGLAGVCQIAWPRAVRGYRVSRGFCLSENGVSRMFKHLPGRTEVVLFAVMAVVCAAVVHTIGAPDTGLSLFSFPIFVFSAILGLWKSGRLRASDDLD
jgi:hypothetical protein